MKFITAEQDGARFPGLLTGTHVVDLNKLALSRSFVDLNDFIANHRESDLAAIRTGIETASAIPVEEVTLLAPIEKPVHDILCVGLNYQKHIEESQTMLKKQGDLPKHLSYFSKRAHAMLGPEGELRLDPGLDDALDYEVELAVVIGKEGKDIKAEEALDYIFGYTILNDFSARTLQAQHGQWFRGKSLDGYTAIGPSIVHKSSLPHPFSASLSLSVNGETRQSSHTDYMIKDVAGLIEELSRGMTLVPGDIIATGTPEGVGMGFDPPRYLKRDDIVTCYIEGIGTLKNHIG